MNLREVIIQFNSRFDPRGMLAMMSTMNKAKTEVERFEGALKRISTALIGMGTAAVLAFKNYESALTEFAGKAMNTVDVFSAKFTAASGQISRETGLMRREVLRGLQEGTSALLGPEDAARVTKKAAILSAGNQARMAQAMGVALSGYRNKFGSPAKVLDYTYASAQLGQGQVAEFAPAWQYVLGFARGAGLEIKEVASGIAAISATAPSPLMGSTQFGAFLTGIARGSTYEDKLKEMSGKSSQDLRDMLRNEGLAKTTEFLASKFTGDELQQVFGRKEFVQFVQGTTGRRGILAKLEKLIVDNVESQPIEKFGEDLTWTLQNKLDRFLRAFEQVGTEYGAPLAFAAKGLVTVGRTLLEAAIKLNQGTGGGLALALTIAGAAFTGFALLRTELKSFILGVLAHVTGLTNVFYDRYTGVGKAAQEAFSSAAKGGKTAAAGEAARGAWRSYGSPSVDAAAARAQARAASDSAKAQTAGVAAEAASARVHAKAASDSAKAQAARASAEAAAGTGFDTGGKAWNDARKARQESILRAFGREGEDFERRSSAAGASDHAGPKPKQGFDTGGKAWNDARRARQESIFRAFGREGEDFERRARMRERQAAYRASERGQTFEKRFAENFDPNFHANRAARRKMEKEVLRSMYERQVVNMTAIVDDLIKQGKLDPKYRRSALHSLMNIKQPLNDYFTIMADEAFMYSEDLFKRTGYRRYGPHENPFNPNATKASKVGGWNTGHWGYRVNIDDMLYKKWRGHGATIDDITEDMVMKKHKDKFRVLSAMPFLDPDMYKQKYRKPVNSHLEAVLGVMGTAGAGFGPSRSTSGRKSPFLLPPPKPGFQAKGFKIPKGHPWHKRNDWSDRGMDINNGMGSWMWILGALPQFLGDMWRGGQNPNTMKKVFGGGGFGTGFAAGMAGEGFNDMLGGVMSYNASAESKGRKHMRENVAKMAWFMGKFWKVGTSPWALIPAAIAAVWAGAVAIFNRSDTGRAHLDLVKYREESLFNQQKILELQVKQGVDLYNMIMEGVNARNPEGKGQTEYSGVIDFFTRMWGKITETETNRMNKILKYTAAEKMLTQYGAGKMSPEEQARMFTWFWKAGVTDFEPVHSPSSLFLGKPFSSWRITFADDHDKVMRLPTAQMGAQEYEDGGRSSFTSKMHWALIKGDKALERLEMDGPLGARIDAYTARGMAARADIGSDGKAVHFMPIESIVNLYAEPGEDLAARVSDEVRKQMFYFGLTLQRDGSSATHNTDLPSHPAFQSPALVP